MSRFAYPRDGDNSSRGPAPHSDWPSWRYEIRPDNERDLPQFPGPGGERWAQAPLGDTQPLAPGKA